MKNKIAIAVSAALMGVGGYTVAAPILNPSIQVPSNLKHAAPAAKGQSSKSSKLKFVEEPGLANKKYTYIVRLADSPVASYSGSISGLAATKLDKASVAKSAGKGKLNVSSAKVKSYVQYLNAKQSNVMMMAAAAGVRVIAKEKFHYAFNGFSAELTPEQAKTLSQLPEVAYVEREASYQLATDSSPAFVGADKVWDGTATGTAAMGEGVIVGVLDTGINTDHPSFADIGGDGYDHTNPWGQGVYVGDCAGDFASMCNDKLIGVRSYEDITDDYDDTAIFGDTPPAKNGEDYNGHGSHTASTAAGNVLIGVPYVTPDPGKEESDGIVTDLVFDRVAGIAPHANIVAYQICSPGDTDDTYAGCPTSAILKALDDAVADGVDVINYSISGGGNPWDSATEMGFLAARDAGIFAAVAAGNGDQGPYTTSKSAPWYTAVAASTHPREIGSAVSFAGESYLYTVGSGPAIAEDITAPVTYVADDLDGCAAFPADAFSGKLALIQRGSCNFATKVGNAADAGAVGVIVFNADGDDSRLTMAGLEDSTIPAVFLGNTDGAAIKASIDANGEQSATLSAKVITAEGQGDVLASFSLLGPNSYIDVMTPSIAAPGVDIYAAQADQHYGHDVTGPAPSDFTLMSGTSMATPHVAGAGALLKSAHPDWTPDNIRSALMLTATTAQAMTKADATTPADEFDVGAGRIRVDLAAETGLVMDEADDNYVDADPDLGGDPRTLNIPSMTDSTCVTTCSWTRTVTATGAGTWAASSAAIDADSGLALTVTPATFTLAAGESQTLTITADVSDLADTSTYAFGQLELTSDDYPAARMPIAVMSARSNLPAQISIEAGRDKDQFVTTGLKHLDLTGVQASVSGLNKADIYQSTVGQDSDVSDFLDDLSDGVDYVGYRVPENAQMFVTKLSSDVAPDLDLWVMVDVDGDGSLDGYAGYSLHAGSDESVSITNPIPGDYYIFVQSYQASSATAQDPFTLKTTIVTDEADDNFSVDLSGDNTDFSLAYTWDDSFTVGDESYAMLVLSSTDETADDVSIPVVLTRVEDDVVLPSTASLAGELAPGVTHTISMPIAANRSDVARTYTINALLPMGQEAANVSDGGEISEGSVAWTITQAPHAVATAATFDFIPRQAGDYTMSINNIVDSANAESISQDYSFSVAEVAPELVIEGPAEVGERETFTLDASGSSDANADELTFKWVQLAGTPVSFDATASSISPEAPDVDDAGEILTFQVTVSDPHGNSKTDVVTVNVYETPNSGGALGWMSLLLMPLVWLRRKTA
ncbi:protease [Shewanella mangrovi]|uniref:Protease n=1 Tax=Shewanella mangrovi TaxID=1515746 RepID=A0A094JXZ7_9GAMM|nr:S8 family serine peptidase [Shewanella mangrovi]KFZ37301.1 protease [Shewanella mangrovi]